MATAKKNFESILLDRSWVSEQDLERARQRKKPGQDLADVLVDMGALEPQRLARAIAQEYWLPFQAHVDEHAIDSALLGKVPINYAKKNGVLPLSGDGHSVTVAIADPSNYEPLDDLRMLFGMPVHPVVVPLEILNDAINRSYDQATTTTAQDLMIDLEEDRLDVVANELAQEPLDLLDSDDAAPIIKLVNGLLSQAVKDRASDIHVEPFERELLVRFRVDGMLYDVISPPKRFQPAITSRVKVMAGLNIAEKRLPQDGRIRLRVAGRDIDIRVSTIPTAFGERIVLRLLDRAQALVDLNLDRLGFSGDNLTRIDRLIRQSHGIILATGPTGSGKTTSLYACLARINSPEKNIITIEDPIEYQLRGIGQMQVSPKIELTFASGLRSILRQDPDVIMVGEIRDSETAEIAIHAALTGHLVFSTLHTNDSFGALTRLVDMGIEPFLVSSSILAVLAQRLVRMVCPTCREPYTPTPTELTRIGVRPESVKGPIYRPAANGCRACRNTGYRGRMAIQELMLMDDEVRALVMQKADAATIRRTCTAHGMTLLRQNGAQRILLGETTVEELLRVTQEDIL
ncbi:MAG TPA: type II secretion system ATPase GspE [Candidatus Binataceae bacterium]|jgi:general secretion pathway protein E|nr:type II secretion system ATPase GspE [Candidatus Binataceae bacterium]